MQAQKMVMQGPFVLIDLQLTFLGGFTSRMMSQIVLVLKTVAVQLFL